MGGVPEAKAEEMEWKTACAAETAGAALLAAQAPSLLPSLHPVEISWEQVLSCPCPGANPQSHCQVSSGTTLAVLPQQRALLAGVSVLYPCYSPCSLGYEKSSDGVLQMDTDISVLIHQILILCYSLVF